MAEVIAFFAGLIAMGIIWFIEDTESNPYMRGYAEGLGDGLEEALKMLEKAENEIEEDEKDE